MPLWPLVAAGFLILLTATGTDDARSGLRYDRQGIEAGQWWRLISGHFVHLGWSHTFLNLAGLILVVLLFPKEMKAWQWLVLLLAGVTGISLGFLVLRPDLNWYVGLSGVLHGLFAAGAVSWMVRREPEGLVLALFLVLKLAWEQWQGAMPLSVSTSGGPVIVDAHLYGGLIGLAISLMFVRDWRGQRR